MSNSSGVVHSRNLNHVSATHATLEDVPLLVAPATGKESNAFRARMILKGCFKLEDNSFKFDSSFVAPETFDPKPLEQLLKNHPGAKLSIFGHADPSGRDGYNKTLSGRRTQAIFGLLTRQEQLWEDLYYDHDRNSGKDEWGVGAVQTMLLVTGFPAGRNDGELDDATRQALRDFEKSAGLPQSGFTNKQVRRETFRKLARAYMDVICVGSSGTQFVLGPNDFLARGIDKNGKGDYQGCGEFNPLMIFSASEQALFDRDENKPERNRQNAVNRRVMILLFRPGTQVDPQKWPCPTVKQGPEGCHNRFFSDAEKRRSNQAERREAKDTKDTFACRFYDRITNDSPCERHTNLDDFWIIRIDKSQELQPDDSVALESADVNHRAVVQAKDAVDSGKFLDFLFAPGPEADYDISLKVGPVTYKAWRRLHLPGDGQGIEAAKIQYGADDDGPNPYSSATRSSDAPLISVSFCS